MQNDTTSLERKLFKANKGIADIIIFSQVSSHLDPSFWVFELCLSNINSPASFLHSRQTSLLISLQRKLLCCLSQAFVPTAPSLERPDPVHDISLLLILVILSQSPSLNHWHSYYQWHVFLYNANQVFKSQPSNVQILPSSCSRVSVTMTEQSRNSSLSLCS